MKIDSYHQGEQIAEIRYCGNDVEFLVGRGTTMFAKSAVSFDGVTRCREVMYISGLSKLEFGFRIDAQLSGNAAAGWTDPGNYIRFQLQFSQDLVNWSFGKFLPADIPVVDLGDGVFEYWGVSSKADDSAQKIGDLSVTNTYGNPLANGFTSIVIAGVAQNLPHFPYNMTVAGTAAMLQADLVAAGFPGAVVLGSTATNWEIEIPAVQFTALQQPSYVGFPSFMLPDVNGVLNTPCDRIAFGGDYRDPDGAPIVPRMFGRLHFSPGSRYQP